MAVNIYVSPESPPVYALVESSTTVIFENFDPQVIPPTGSDNEGSLPIRPTEQLDVITDGQTIFQLSAVPSYPERVRLYINGLKVSFGQDFMIDGQLLKWITTKYALTTSDTVEVII